MICDLHDLRNAVHLSIVYNMAYSMDGRIAGYAEDAFHYGRHFVCGYHAVWNVSVYVNPYPHADPDLMMVTDLTIEGARYVTYIEDNEWDDHCSDD